MDAWYDVVDGRNMGVADRMPPLGRSGIEIAPYPQSLQLPQHGYMYGSPGAVPARKPILDEDCKFLCGCELNPRQVGGHGRNAAHAPVGNRAFEYEPLLVDCVQLPCRLEEVRRGSDQRGDRFGYLPHRMLKG